MENLFFSTWNNVSTNRYFHFKAIIKNMLSLTNRLERHWIIDKNFPIYLLLLKIEIYFTLNPQQVNEYAAGNRPFEKNRRLHSSCQHGFIYFPSRVLYNNVAKLWIVNQNVFNTIMHWMNHFWSIDKYNSKDFVLSYCYFTSIDIQRTAIVHAASIYVIRQNLCSKKLWKGT